MIRLEKFHKESFALANARHDMPSSPNTNPPEQRSFNPRVVPILRTMAEIAYFRAKDAARILLAPIVNTPVAISAGYVSKLSKDLCREEKSSSRIKTLIRQEPIEIIRVQNLPTTIDPVQFYPTKVELHQGQVFGKNNPYKLYSIKPMLSNIAVILWKSGLLDPDNRSNLAKAIPNGQATQESLNKLCSIDFSALQLLPFDYDIYNSPEVESIFNELKKELCDACLLRYNMNLSAVQRYCGGRWTGEHRRTDQMLQVMSHILPDKLFLELVAAMVDGVSNLLNAELLSEEVASLLATPNLPTLEKIQNWWTRQY